MKHSIWDGFTDMPKGVIPLYGVQALSTFSFAIFFSSLSLFLTKDLGFSHIDSNSLVGIFLAFNFTLHLFGGVIGGSLISNRSLFALTTICQLLGLVLLSISSLHFLHIGLAVFLVGSSLNTTCFNTLLSQMFDASDKRRDTAFFISYGAMNVGFCLGYIASGFFDDANCYTGLFEIGAVFCFLTFFLFLRWFPEYKDKRGKLASVESPSKRLSSMALGLLVIAILIPVSTLSFNFASLSNDLVLLASACVFFFIIYLIRSEKNNNSKGKIKAYLLLAIFSVLFWMIYYTGPMGVTLFVKNNVDRHLLGYSVATQWISNINALMVIIGAPFVDLIIKRLKISGINLSAPRLFAGGFLFLALSFVTLSLGIALANKSGYSSLSWTIVHFLFQGIAELLIAPVGLALVGNLSPPNLSGVLMGIWMMVSGVSASLSHHFSNAMVVKGSTSIMSTNIGYFQVFNTLSLAALGSCLALFIFSSFLNRSIGTKAKLGNSVSEGVS